jgi:hypothetical protein
MNPLRDLKWAGLEGAVTAGAVVRRDDAQRKQILIGQVVDVPATAGRAGEGRYSHGLVVRLTVIGASVNHPVPVYQYKLKNYWKHTE